MVHGTPQSGMAHTVHAKQAESSFNPFEWAYIELIDEFASVCTVISVCIAGYQIIQHIRHFNEPQIQLQIIRILAIIPVSALRTNTRHLGILNFYLVFHHAPSAYICSEYNS